MKVNSKGFTLIEILVALAISGLVLTAIYQAYHSQQKAYIVQEKVAEMQQNLRAAMFMMTSELRMAGYDPSGDAGAGIISINDATVSSCSINFSKDLNSNGNIAAAASETGENISYLLNASRQLVRREIVAGVTTNAAVAENIDALNLVFLDSTGAPTGTLSNIRSIEITLVARSQRSEEKYTNNFVYENQQGDSVLTPGGDNIRRAILTSQVKCRNLGL